MLILHVFNKLVNSLLLNNRGSRGLMIIESWTRNTKVASLSLGPAGIVGEVNVQRSLHFQHHDRGALYARH